MTCAECGDPTSNRSGICDKCAPLYADQPLVTDECQCVSCRPDMKGVVPCVKGTERGNM